MTMSDRKHTDCNPTNIVNNTDANDYRQLAAIIVDNLLTKAISKASEQLLQSRAAQMNLPQNTTNSRHGLHLNLPPAIQIDLAGTRTPSPEEESLIDWSVNKKNYIFKAPVVPTPDQQSTSIDTDFSINDYEPSLKDVDSIFTSSHFDISSKNNMDLDDIKDFAKDYIKNIITSALESIDLKQLDNDNVLLKTSLSNDHQCCDSGNTCMIGIRHVFARLMRTACFCKSRQQFRRHNNNNKS